MKEWNDSYTLRQRFITGVKAYRQGEAKVLVVDRARATFFGTPYHTLSTVGRRKFDNRLFIENCQQELQIIYQ